MSLSLSLYLYLSLLFICLCLFQCRRFIRSRTAGHQRIGNNLMFSDFVFVIVFVLVFIFFQSRIFRWPENENNLKWFSMSLSFSFYLYWYFSFLVANIHKEEDRGPPENWKQFNFLGLFLCLRHCLCTRLCLRHCLCTCLRLFSVANIHIRRRTAGQRMEII